jgi:regulator of RNase E activity RraB
MAADDKKILSEEEFQKLLKNMVGEFKVALRLGSACNEKTGDSLFAKAVTAYAALRAELAAKDAEIARLRELCAGDDDGGHWYSQQTMGAVSSERDAAQKEVARLKSAIKEMFDVCNDLPSSLIDETERGCFEKLQEVLNESSASRLTGNRD